MAYILVADDSVTIRRRLRELLEEIGHQVIEASNGNEALEMLETHAVDLIVLDIVMPEKDGIETLIELSRRSIDLPVIAMSGTKSGAVDYLETAKKFGADHVVDKPFSPKDILDLVTNALWKPE